MKVKELIERLKDLDGERNIYICYDGFSLSDPIPDTTMTKNDVKFFKNDAPEAKEGDYIITV